MIKKHTWVLVAQKGKAKLFEYHGKERGLEEVQSFVNPSSELRNQQLVSDRPGRGSNSATGRNRHGLPATEDPREHAFNVFARELASVIDKGISTRACEEVMLVAEPHCLGKIRSELSDQTLSHLSHSIPKDLFRLSERELLQEMRAI